MDMQRLWILPLMLGLALHFSGCAALWFGAGAATGAAVEDELEERDDEN